MQLIQTHTYAHTHRNIHRITKLIVLHTINFFKLNGKINQITFSNNMFVTTDQLTCLNKPSFLSCS